MTHRIAPPCLQIMLLCFLINSPLDVIAQRGQDDIPVVNPMSPGGTTTTTQPITQPSLPSSTFPDPITNPNPPTGGYPPLDGTTPTGGNPPLDGTTPTGGGGGAPSGGRGGDTGASGGGAAPGGGGGGGGQWCIAKANASPTSLQVALDYACGYEGAFCGQIQQGASCYEPKTIHDHASFAFNSYYDKYKQTYFRKRFKKKLGGDDVASEGFGKSKAETRNGREALQLKKEE